jgi:hypothetical protein
MNSPRKKLAEILVYKRNAAPLPEADFPLSQLPVSHVSTRKQFFAKLAGMAAAASVLPKLFAKSAPALSPSHGPATRPVAPAAPVALRPETRAVARRADSV